MIKDLYKLFHLLFIASSWLRATFGLFISFLNKFPLVDLACSKNCSARSCSWNCCCKASAPLRLRSASSLGSRGGRRKARQPPEWHGVAAGAARGTGARCPRPSAQGPARGPARGPPASSPAEAARPLPESSRTSRFLSHQTDQTNQHAHTFNLSLHTSMRCKNTGGFLLKIQECQSKMKEL